MIKKFVSGALLSVVMDKEAREKLARIKAAKSSDSADSGPSSAPASPPPAKAAETAQTAPVRAEDAPRNVRVRSPAAEIAATAPAAAPAAAKAAQSSSLSSSPGLGLGKDSEDPLALIEGAVAAARQSLGMDPPPRADKAAEKPEKTPEALKKAVPARPAAKTKAKPKGAAPPGRVLGPGAPGSERERLINEALAIHAEKSRLLDELAPGLKDKLRLMALKQLDPKAYEEIRREAMEDEKKRAVR